jgi:hypothetical protein
LATEISKEARSNLNTERFKNKLEDIVLWMSVGPGLCFVPVAIIE